MDEEFTKEDLRYIKKINFRTIKINEKKAERLKLIKMGLHKYVKSI
jgi:hypothetical protein